jgi:RNA polymerase sigma-70 factor (ECF subfamily)
MIMQMHDSNSQALERDLLLKIAGRNELAFGTIYNQYHKKIYTFALRLLKSKQMAEEVVQESFLKVWLMGDALNKISNIEAYLVTIARNRSLDALRKQQRESKASFSNTKAWTEAHNETEETIILNDTRGLLQSAVDLLPPQQKLVYQLCHQEGLKYEDAAEKLNLSPLTVKTHMQHALRFLRAHVLKNSDIGIALVLLKIL